MFTRSATIELMEIAQVLPKEKQNRLLEELRRAYHESGHKKPLSADEVRQTALKLGMLKEAHKPIEEDG